jgi:hypothetical protein
LSNLIKSGHEQTFTRTETVTGNPCTLWRFCSGPNWRFSVPELQFLNEYFFQMIENEFFIKKGTSSENHHAAEPMPLPAGEWRQMEVRKKAGLSVVLPGKPINCFRNPKLSAP